MLYNAAFVVDLPLQLHHVHIFILNTFIVIHFFAHFHYQQTVTQNCIVSFIIFIVTKVVIFTSTLAIVLVLTELFTHQLSVI